MFARQGRQRVNQSESLPSPIGGINDVDPISVMSPTHCLALVNWIASPSNLVLRDGNQTWVDEIGGLGTPATITKLIPYFSNDGTERMFAVGAKPTGGHLYEVTTTQSDPDAIIACNYSATSYAQMTNIATSFLIVAGKGSEPPIVFNGTTWGVMATDDPGNPYTISGVAAQKLMGVTLFKHRLWFVEEGSMTAWYLPVDSVSGTATPFYLGGVFSRGGNLNSIAVWSFNAGDGMDARIVFRSSNGEVAVYAGTDPDVPFGEPGAFGLQAVYYTTQPVGFYATGELGSDLVFLTRAGLVPVSSLVQGKISIAEYENTLSRNISSTLSRLTRERQVTDNWEIMASARANTLAINIPAQDNVPAIQFVMNAITGAWSTWNLPATCMGQIAQRVYFGTRDGRVCRHHGTRDNVDRGGTGGVPIQGSLFSSFNYLGDPNSIKSFKLVRPMFQSQVDVRYLLEVRTDFNTQSLAGNPDNPGSLSFEYLFDSAVWDEALWGSREYVFRPWVGVEGLGYSVAVLLKVASETQLQFPALQIIYERGDGV